MDNFSFGPANPINGKRGIDFTARTFIQVDVAEATRNPCGAFTKVVFEPYSFIGGEHGVRLGYPTQTAEGRSCMVWTHSPT